jgi:hypothetical protein
MRILFVVDCLVFCGCLEGGFAGKQNVSGDTRYVSVSPGGKSCGDAEFKTPPKLLVVGRNCLLQAELDACVTLEPSRVWQHFAYGNILPPSAGHLARTRNSNLDNSKTYTTGR